MPTSRARTDVPVEETLPLEESLAFQVAMIHYTTSRHIAEQFGDFDLTSNQWKVLSVVYHRGPLPAREVSRWCTLDQAAVSRAVQKLIARKLILRTRRGNERRAMDLTVTQAGLDIQQGIAVEIARYQREILEEFSSSEQAFLLSALNRLRRKLQDTDVLPAPTALRTEG